MERFTEGQMQRLTAPLATTADKIRALGRAGVSTADIGRFLGIRYQHAYNVLKRSGIAAGGGEVRDEERPAPAGPDKTRLEDGGAIHIPANILEAWNAQPGDDLLVRLDGDELRIMTRAAGVRRASDIMRPYRSGESLVDELIAERRREMTGNE